MNTPNPAQVAKNRQKRLYAEKNVRKVVWTSEKKDSK